MGQETIHKVITQGPKKESVNLLKASEPSLIPSLERFAQEIREGLSEIAVFLSELEIKPEITIEQTNDIYPQATIKCEHPVAVHLDKIQPKYDLNLHTEPRLVKHVILALRLIMLSILVQTSFIAAVVYIGFLK